MCVFVLNTTRWSSILGLKVCVLQWERLVWVHVCSFKEKKQGREKTSERARWGMRKGIACLSKCVCVCVYVCVGERESERKSEWASERWERWNRNKAAYHRDFNTHCAILPTPSITVLWPQQHCVCVCVSVCVCVFVCVCWWRNTLVQA